MRRAIPLLLFTFLFTASLESQTPAERFHTAEARWSSHRPDGTTLHDDSEAARNAADAMWSAVADQGLATLKAHPSLTADEFAKSFTSLELKPDPRVGPQLSASAIKLEASTFALAFNDDVAGTVFVFGSRSGAPALLWSLTQPGSPAAQPADPKGLLRAWEPARQGEACRKPHGGANLGGTCGPLTASLNSLPADGAGHPRFLIDAAYTQDMGATFGKQLSLWAWDGAAPHLLWINLYTINADQHLGLSYNAGTLEIGEKGHFRTFFACGSCDGRQLVHTLRLTDAGVDDLGTRSTAPELDAMDTLFATLADKKDTASLASAEAVSTLQPLITKARANSAKVGPEYFSLGLLESSSVHTRGGVADVCLVTEATGQIDATLEKRGGQFFISSVAMRPSSPDAGCK